MDTLLSLLPQSAAPVRSAIEQVSVKMANRAPYSQLLIICDCVMLQIVHFLFLVHLFDFKQFYVKYLFTRYFI